VAIGLVGLISSLPGRPIAWKSSASSAVTDGPEESDFLAGMRLFPLPFAPFLVERFCFLWSVAD
jgi:hypothetical protein